MKTLAQKEDERFGRTIDGGPILGRQPNNRADVDDRALAGLGWANRSATALARRAGAVALRLTILAISSGFWSTKPPAGAVPALLIRMPMR